MMVKIWVSLLLYIAILENVIGGCKKPVDISVILEVPKVGRSTVIREASEFFKTLLYKVNFSKCKRVAITAADHQVVNVKTFQCESLSCGIQALMNFSALENKEAKPTDPSPKENVILALNQLEAKYIEGGSAKHVVLVILTSQQQDGVSIADQVKTYVENGYSFIAVGIGEGQKERLDRISYSNERVIYMAAIDELNAENNQNRRRILELIENPDAITQSAPAVRDYLDLVGVDLDFYEYVADDEICKYVVDIVFLIDSSMSIKFNYREELYFVSRLAGRFDISELGTHAAAVVFSDHIPYTLVTVRLNESVSTRLFQTVISKSPFIGYRTRIDLAFELVTTDIFTIRNGVRPNINKAIVLLTDGKQNPKSVGSIILDPMRASQELFEKGVKIFAVGIGTDVNKKQLGDITRDPNRVFFAETFEKLASLEFVRNVSKRVCAKTGELGSLIYDGKSRNLVENDNVKKCKDKVTPVVGQRSKCCGNNDVYINIFQPNSGPTYIFQGMKMEKSGDKLTGVKLPIKQQPKVKIDGDISKLPINELIKVIKQSLPEQVELANTIEVLLHKFGETNNGEIGIPGLERGKRKRRKSRGRRSLENNTDRNMPFKTLKRLAQVTGCKMFLAAIEKRGILQNVTSMMNQHKGVTIFCPLDEAYQKVYSTEYQPKDELDILLHHIAFKQDLHGIIYETLLPGKTIIMKSHTTDDNKVSWKANNADVKVSFTDGQNDIIIMNDVIHPKTIGVLDALKALKNCSVFYEMLLNSGTSTIFTTTEVEKICFTKDICVPVTRTMQKHLSTVMKFNQFTIIAPINAALTNLERNMLKTIMTDAEVMREFLKGHVFLGLLDNPSETNRQQIEIAYSLSSDHSVLTASTEENKIILKDAMNRVFKVQEKISVTEGTLYIVEDMV